MPGLSSQAHPAMVEGPLTIIDGTISGVVTLGVGAGAGIAGAIGLPVYCLMTNGIQGAVAGTLGGALILVGGATAPAALWAHSPK